MIFNFDTPEREAAKTLGIAMDTLKRDRLEGKIPSYVFVKFGHKRVRYCLPLVGYLRVTRGYASNLIHLARTVEK
jgi:hypothetical protein